jgi:hypothetical protein
MSVTAAIILGACIVAYAIYLAAEKNRTVAKPENFESSKRKIAWYEQAKSLWAAILAEDRYLTNSELTRYTNFIDMRNAIRISEGDGRGADWTGKDLVEGDDVRLQHVQAAETLNEVRKKALAARRADPGDRSLIEQLYVNAQQIEDHLVEAGEVNVLRDWKQSSWTDG